MRGTDYTPLAPAQPRMIPVKRSGNVTSRARRGILVVVIPESEVGHSPILPESKFETHEPVEIIPEIVPAIVEDKSGLVLEAEVPGMPSIVYSQQFRG